MCSTVAHWAFAALPTFCNTANPYRRTRPSNPEWFRLVRDSLSLQLISRVSAACLPLLDGQNSGEGGYYADPPKNRCFDRDFTVVVGA